MHLQRIERLVRRLVSPRGFDQSVAGDDTVRLEQQGAQDHAIDAALGHQGTVLPARPPPASPGSRTACSPEACPLRRSWARPERTGCSTWTFCVNETERFSIGSSLTPGAPRRRPKGATPGSRVTNRQSVAIPSIPAPRSATLPRSVREPPASTWNSSTAPAPPAST